ncbi:MAG TPA: aminoacyl-tRNA hydrolase [Candidatus Paceibacterota bacterium]|nr:aminoacyl-tRNA hydrolase [Candidatus Paceibacterota bacterium]
MPYIVAALGNPDDPYKLTRHNAGRIVLDAIVKEEGGEWKSDSMSDSLISKVSITTPESAGSKKKSTPILAVKPETFMNKSGSAIKKYVKTKAEAEKLVVLHDDLDLGIGTIKLSFDRGAGGHNGVASIVSAIKTEAFTRIRIGISPVGAKGVKKPVGAERVEKHILKDFSADELTALKKVGKKIHEALGTLLAEGREVAMNKFN